MTFSEMPVLCCLSHNASLFQLKPETTKKNTTHSSSPTKDLSYLQRTSKFNNLQFNCCNCLFLITGHDCALCRFTIYRQHNVHWTELQCDSLTSRPLLQVKSSLQIFLTHACNTYCIVKILVKPLLNLAKQITNCLYSNSSILFPKQILIICNLFGFQGQ